MTLHIPSVPSHSTYMLSFIIMLVTTSLRTCSCSFQGIPRRQLTSFYHRTRTLSSSSSSSLASNVELSVQVQIGSPELMEEFGGILSRGTKAGDVILLDGDLGAGKTCFSRGFIRARVGRPRMRVTSPTFLLTNTYFAEDDNDSGGVEIHHMDVYRLSGSEDLEPLDLPRVFSECIALIEWPSQLGSLVVPDERLELNFEIDEDTEMRYAELKPCGEVWTNRVQELLNDGTIEPFLSSKDV